jgi:hypothetical protein
LGENSKIILREKRPKPSPITYKYGVRGGLPKARGRSTSTASSQTVPEHERTETCKVNHVGKRLFMREESQTRAQVQTSDKEEADCMREKKSCKHENFLSKWAPIDERTKR